MEKADARGYEDAESADDGMDALSRLSHEDRIKWNGRWNQAYGAYEA